MLATPLPECTSRTPPCRDNFHYWILVQGKKMFQHLFKIGFENPPSWNRPLKRTENPSRKSVPKIRSQSPSPNPSPKSVPKIRPQVGRRLWQCCLIMSAPCALYVACAFLLPFPGHGKDAPGVRPRCWRKSQAGFGVFRERKKHIKNETRKQNFHGIVPGFWGEFCLCVFLPHKEWAEKNTSTNFRHPPSPGTIPQICLCLCVFSFPEYYWYQSFRQGRPFFRLNREQKRHIRKNHINFLKTSWMAGCPWDTRPVSRQKCPFLSVFSIVNNKKSLGHRPVDPCLSRRVSQGHPAGVPGIFLEFMCPLLSWLNRVASMRLRNLGGGIPEPGSKNSMACRCMHWGASLPRQGTPSSCRPALLHSSVR